MPPPTPKVESEARHRSGAVARMLRMPVATLRVWERRYGVTQPMLTARGQRLYSADDVRRLALIKQLTDLGHAIGSLARLDMVQLQQVASTHASVLVSRQATEPAAPYPAPPRRWDDAALADFAGLSTTIACECPRHVAALLMQLTQFEAYSTECRHRSAADADLHAYLQQVAGRARAEFEAALEHVARHEGLISASRPEFPGWPVGSPASVPA